MFNHIYVQDPSITGRPCHMKCSTEAIVTLKRNRADSERIIGKYMKITDPKLMATEFEFVASLMPDYIAPTIDGIKLILDER